MSCGRVNLWSRSREIGSSPRRQWDASFKLINSEIRERPVDPLINKLANFISPRPGCHITQLKYKPDRWYRWRVVFETFNIFDSFRLKIVKFNRFQFSYRTLYYCQEEARLIFFFFFLIEIMKDLSALRNNRSIRMFRIFQEFQSCKAAR